MGYPGTSPPTMVFFFFWGAGIPLKFGTKASRENMAVFHRVSETLYERL